MLLPHIRLGVVAGFKYGHEEQVDPHEAGIRIRASRCRAKADSGYVLRGVVSEGLTYDRLVFSPGMSTSLHVESPLQMARSGPSLRMLGVLEGLQALYAADLVCITVDVDEAEPVG